MGDLIPTLRGAKEFLEWFGRWPSFHDAEIREIRLSREGPSLSAIHVFKMTSKLDTKGFYVCESHTTLKLLLSDVTSCELNGFNHQNVIDHLEIYRNESGYLVTLYPIYGVGGTVTCAAISIEFEPGIPAASAYQG
jgi:hypothetical protein